MKKSIYPLILLFVVCVSLPLLLKLSEGMTTSKDSSGNTQYTYTNDLDNLTKSKTMNPSEDIATPNTNLPSNFFDSIHTGPYYTDDGEDESKYMTRSKNFSGYLDASGNRTTYESTNVTSIPNNMNTNPSTNPSTNTNVTTDSIENKINTSLGVIQFLKNLFNSNKESFDPIRVLDSSNNTYDISSNYELYNVNGMLGMGVHDTTDYGSMLDSLEKDYNDLRSKMTSMSNNSSNNSSSNPSSSGSVKCIADFATNIGEDLCCGQTGVLQDTRYVCPSNQPTCSNFKCGSKFGTCS